MFPFAIPDSKLYEIVYMLLTVGNKGGLKPHFKTVFYTLHF